MKRSTEDKLRKGVWAVIVAFHIIILLVIIVNNPAVSAFIIGFFAVFAGVSAVFLWLVGEFNIAPEEGE